MQADGLCLSKSNPESPLIVNRTLAFIISLGFQFTGLYFLNLLKIQQGKPSNVEESNDSKPADEGQNPSTEDKGSNGIHVENAA